MFISNLLSNAVKYTDKGTINFNVNCNINGNNCLLIIEVRDTGRGINPDNLDKLFDKFYREQGDIDSSISGTGLGLSITKSLVELMNGKIDVDSELGVGSTFVVSINQKISND